MPSNVLELLNVCVQMPVSMSQIRSPPHSSRREEAILLSSGEKASTGYESACPSIVCVQAFAIMSQTRMMPSLEPTASFWPSEEKTLDVISAVNPASACMGLVLPPVMSHIRTVVLPGECNHSAILRSFGENTSDGNRVEAPPSSTLMQVCVAVSQTWILPRATLKAAMLLQNALNLPRQPLLLGKISLQMPLVMSHVRISLFKQSDETQLPSGKNCTLPMCSPCPSRVRMQASQSFRGDGCSETQLGW